MRRPQLGNVLQREDAARSATGSVTITRLGSKIANSGCLTKCRSPLDMMTSNGSNGRRLSISRIASGFMDSPFRKGEQSATMTLYHSRRLCNGGSHRQTPEGAAFGPTIAAAKRMKGQETTQALAAQEATKCPLKDSNRPRIPRGIRGFARKAAQYPTHFPAIRPPPPLPARRRKAAGTAAAVAGGHNEGEGADEGGRLDKLAAALLTLSPAERERLAAMLTAHQAEGKAVKPL